MKLISIVVLALACFSMGAQESKPAEKPLDFQEVFNLIKSNLSDITPQELDRAAALGLIRELGTRVQLVTTNESAPAEATEGVTRRAVYLDKFGYIQLRGINGSLPADFQRALQSLTASNALKGLVLDLRYAGGTDYDAAASVAQNFNKKGEAILRIGENDLRPESKLKPIELPIAVLVNHETSGAAEAIAAAVQQAGAGLMIGSPTAGEARLFETFTLGSGQKLKIGKIPVETADHKAIPSKGLTPDIAVTVSPGLEKIWYEDPYKNLPIAGAATGARTNGTAAASRARRFNEAELVRRHREGSDGDLFDEPLTGGAEMDRPVILDPALARALDFLKGIAVLQQHRPQ